MFQVDAVLTAPDIQLKPTASECHNIIIHSVKDFLERFVVLELYFLLSSMYLIYLYLQTEIFFPLDEWNMQTCYFN